MIARAYRHALNGSQLAPGRPLLEVMDVSLRFGGIRALAHVGLTVAQGHVHAVIGPNGAGKSSLLNCISGLYRPQQGTIVLHSGPHTARPSGNGTRDSDPSQRGNGAQGGGRDGTHDLVRMRPHRVARLGVARSFQNIELFRHLTVLENLMLGRHVHMRHRLLPSLAWYGPARRQEIAHRELVEEVIDLLQIQAVRHQPVGALAYGFQKRVELGRALCMQPALLLLDEPMAGMNTEEKEDMARFVLDVNELAGVTVMLIEHDMNVVMDISDRVSVLDFGELIAEGTPAEVSGNPDVVKAYLGEELSA